MEKSSGSILKVTVGIPTKDRYEDLTKCLKSVMCQALLPIEVIIVDDGNLTFEQQDYLRTLCEPNILFKYIKKNKPSTSASRNLIARLAEGDFVFLTDDDIVLDPDYIKNIVNFFSKDSNDIIAAVGGVCINQRQQTFIEKIWKKIFILDSGIPCDITATMFESRSYNTHIEKRVKWLPGYTAIFRRDILRKYPFEEFSGGRNVHEEMELGLRLGENYEIWLIPEAKIYHYPSRQGREQIESVGFKHAYNRCVIFNKYAKKGFNRILFAWSFFGYILGLILKGRFSMAKGNVHGICRFVLDTIRGRVNG